MSDERVKSDAVEPRRRAYHSPAREQRAQQTRARILAAARQLFLADGYAPTTMSSVAREAGIAEKTLYLAFPSKASLLEGVIQTTIGGAQERVPLATQHELVMQSPPQEMLTRFAEGNAGVMERTARVLALAEAAAVIDPELAVFRDRGHQAMRARFGGIAAALKARDALATGITQEHAAATIYAVANDSVYLRLVDGYGWTTEDYARWLGRLLTTALTDQQSDKPRPPRPT
ncbi:MAG: TetR/AcrR family transcriptional regulator [Solirubrobacteraceae bacterium]